MIRLRKLCVLAALATLFAAPLRAEQLYRAWKVEYDRSASEKQVAKAIAFDSRGNVIMTGSYRSNGLDQFYTAKYDGLDGHLIWDVIEGAANADLVPASVAVDASDNVVVTGTRNVSGAIDFYTVKYKAADGGLFWVSPAIYNGTASGADTAVKVVINKDGDPVVTGTSRGDNGNPTGDDIVTIKYAASNGAQTALHRFTTAGSRNDFATSMAADPDGSIVVGGAANTASGFLSFYVQRLTPSLTVDWQATISTGGDGGATGVAIDSAGDVIATGIFRTGSQRGIYTAKFAKDTGTLIWQETDPFLSSDAFGQPTGIAVGPDDNPIVTGWLNDQNSSPVAITIKYTSANQTGATKAATQIWATADGGPFGQAKAESIVADGSSNAITFGEAYNADGNFDLYLAKYNTTSGQLEYRDMFPGDFGSTDVGVAIAADANGGVAAVGTPFRKKDSSGLQEIATLRYQRLLLTTGDLLPKDNQADPDRVFLTGNAPAIANTGAVAGKITFAVGKSKFDAIFTQGNAGGTALPAIKGKAAPGAGNWASFSDPVIAPNGRYAFVGKVSGVPSANATGVWTDLSGTLTRAIQTGTPAPGLTENVTSIMAIGLRSNRLIALLKVAAPAPTNTVLLSLDSANNGTVLLRTSATVKKLSVLTPSPTSPGDGRWLSDSNIVAKATLADGRTVLYRINTAGTATEMLTSGTTYKTFGLPAVSASGTRYATLATLAPKTGMVTTANDLRLLYSANGTTFTEAAMEGGTAADANLNGAGYSGFSDPLINNNGQGALLAMLKGTSVKPTTNKALLFGTFGSTLFSRARTGNPATGSDGSFLQTGNPLWSALGPFALPSNAGPLFLGKLSGSGVTPKNALGIWSVDSTGKVRRLLRTGDQLGTRTVSKFTVLNSVPTALSVGRSFNATGAVAAQVTFTDGKVGLLKLATP